mgnify:CR=1 FL=1
MNHLLIVDPQNDFCDVPGAALPNSLTPVEQEEFPADEPLDEVLAGIVWGPAVDGCALSVERLMLPPQAEAGLPTGAEDAAALVAWLCSEEAGWVTGQVIHSEGGFLR